MISAVLFDLDGVIRHFEADDAAEIERRHRLASGELRRVAFSPPLLTEVTTGRITRHEWVQTIGQQIGNAAAAAEWSRLIATVDIEVLTLADELRRLGLTTAVLTNGTDSIATEVEEAGIDRHFDEIFNSADIGFAKPDSRAFKHALQVLNLEPDEVFFTDDTVSNIDGAHALGLTAHLFTGDDELRVALARAGVKVSR